MPQELSPQVRKFQMIKARERAEAVLKAQKAEQLKPIMAANPTLSESQAQKIFDRNQQLARRK